MDYFKTQDGTEIFYKDLGSGFPVILIHGWPLNADMWEYQTPSLLEHGFRVISYDRRGFGRSAQPLKGYDYDTLAGDLNDLISHLELQKTILIGFSMGGGEIARYLSRFSGERVTSTVLISSILPYMLKDVSNPLGIDGTNFDKITAGLAKDRPGFLAAFNKDFYGVGVLKHPVSDQTLNWSASLAYPASPIATIECVSAFGKTDFRADLPAFTVPTLIIHGGEDKTVPIEVSSDEAAKLIPKAIYKRYDGAPHGLFITHKDRLNDDLISFLGSDESTSFARARAFNEKEEESLRL